MIVLTMSGQVIGTPKEGATTTGTPKTTFVLENNDSELPLRFACICFGPSAEKAAEIVEGAEILLTGKMSASSYSRSMTVVVNNLEILGGNDGKH